MKNSFTSFFAGALISVLCAGCNELKQDPELQLGDVPFTEYSFAGESGEEISARWVNLDYSTVSYRGNILVIDSEKELKKYVEGDYPPIDFSKKTLLLAHGYNSGTAFGYDGLQFQQVSNRNYVLTLNGMATTLAVMIKWHVAIIVNKLPSDSNIELKTVITNLP